MEAETITFLSNRKRITIPICEIVRISVYKKGTVVYTMSGNLVSSKTIGEFKQELSDEECFYQSSRTHILNLNFVDRYDDKTIYLKNGTEIPMPVRAKTATQSRIISWQFYNKPVNC
ncbi:MAG: LytTR family transcriptional regulator [Clostridia bacterium]|nr:LytTR family transcriptional regulator [Clostridia bacterium]